ncbi:phage tail protein [Achromobacter marplatensis]|uniref:Phage tail protein n=1 Tax=Achromobacter marplatensis TaxID=470868 RepID=A0AA43B269_9BURK|nr:phage tail protein [Achromobacter marplatensis]MDH2052848.1 phage tail protein [Achromobacter marplatensis]
MAERFTWRATGQPSGVVTFRRLTAQFGDGYRQVAGDGINNKVQSWPLTFVGTRQQMEAMVAFLDRHAGVASFLWTPPFGSEGFYEAPSYSLVPMGGGVYSVSVTFQQVFRP